MQPINQTIETARGMITIREAETSDAIQFRELRLEALQDSPISFSADYQVNADHTMDYWEGRLSKDENSTIFFAEADDRLIGMTGIGRRQSPKTRHSADIYSVYVHPEWRGLHIAEALIEACIQWAKALEVNIVKLGVTSSSISAVRCYQRCGFTIYGTEPRGIFYNGQYHDGYWMYRDLDST